MNYSFNHLIFIDIETVSQKPAFDELPENLQNQWIKKAQTINNDSDVSPQELYFEKAGIYSEFGKIICISIGFLYHKEDNLSIKIKSIANHDEKLLLIELIETLSKNLDETKIQLCAHNGKEFDFPYISRRLLINGLSLPPYLELSGKKPWEIQHIDTMQLWKFGDWKNYTSLDLLTQVFGIESPKDDIDGSDVNKVYYVDADLNRIAKYCNQDVLATAQVYLKLKNLDYEIINITHS